MSLKVSIIIPFQKENDYLSETIFHIDKLNYKNIELILLPDFEISNSFIEKNLKDISFEYKIISTGTVSPAIKRDMGVEKCSGEVVAFIDDDAYPKNDWLDITLKHFEDNKISAVGGPQVTPENDNFWQKVSGAMFLSILNGKAVDRYYPAKSGYEVDDWPSVNLLVRKNLFLKIGGFDNSYWPGEDTKLCLDIINSNQKIIYEPKGVVYHHRRSGFKRHLKQIGNYGLHRGYFAKKYPKTSLKISYMIPSLFFIFVAFGWSIVFINELFQNIYCSIWFLYGVVNIISIFSIYAKTKSFSISISTLPYMVGTHIWYGYRFIKGYFTKDLKSKLGR